MRRIAALLTGVTYLISGSSILAQAPVTNITVSRPPFGFSDIGQFITNALSLAFVIGIIVVLVMFVVGAIQWISSGGDKEGVGAARGRITHAIIGLVILAVSYALFHLAAQFVGFTQVGTGGFSLPILGPGSSVPPFPPPPGGCPQIAPFNPATGLCTP
mgnify:CR=1 FL=1